MSPFDRVLASAAAIIDVNRSPPVDVDRRRWTLMRMHAMQRLALIAAAAAALPAALAAGDGSYELDPFEQATAGFAACPPASPPTLTLDQMRTQAHQRAERGTSCCLAGTCECGGAYKYDPEINARVAGAIRKDGRFRDASVWVTTTRKFITLQGCVRTLMQKRALELLARRQRDVALVWNETTVTSVRHAPLRAK
ncbi:MAG: BON domain-containing protein [Betaproteobacteria bacterium]